MTTVSRLGIPGMLSIAAGVLGGLVVVAYVAIMAMEGNNSLEQVVAWALSMAVPGVLAFVSLRLPQRSARWTRVAAAALFAAFGVVTSLGLGLLPAAVLTGLAAFQTKESISSPADQPHVRL
jgi:chromate transport protein ChrA